VPNRRDAEHPHSLTVARTQLGTDLTPLGDHYLQQFITFREISRLVEGPLDKQSKIDDMLRDVTAMLDENEKEELYSTLLQFAKAMGGVGKFELRDPETGEVLPNEYAGADEAGVNISSPEVSAILSAMVMRTSHHIFAPDKGEMIAQALITSIVSAFGILIGAIARHSFAINKAALEKSDHEFTLEELSKYDSIEEARNELISRRVDALLGGGVDDWSSWCKRVLQFELPSLTSYWPAVREIFARRNIIVHNEGRVNKRYLAAAEDSGITLPEGIKVNDILKTEKVYVDNSIQRILALGMCLVYSVWRKLHPKSAAEAAGWLVSRQEAMVYDEMWVATHEVAHCLKGAPIKRASECFNKIYDWLARIQFEGKDAVLEEVSNWDVSGLDVIFDIYKECLLGNIEEVAELVSRNRGKEYLTKYDLAMRVIQIPM
jgi:hypothetical protein